MNSFAYKLVLLLHLACVVVGFGAAFVLPVLGAKAKKLGPTAPKESYAISHASFEAGKAMTSPVIWAAGAFGILLVPLSDDVFKFSQTWISIAFVIFIFAACFGFFVHAKNLKAMDALAEKLANGDVTPSPGGPPAEATELAERGKLAGMYGGILHLSWLLLMIDMIWKPGLGA